MYLPRPVYEALPYGYVAGGVALAIASWLVPEAPWADLALGVGVLGAVAGLVLILRRRSFRDEATRYDPHSMDDT